jgi:hypothetical protein
LNSWFRAQTSFARRLPNWTPIAPGASQRTNAVTVASSLSGVRRRRSFTSVPNVTLLGTVINMPPRLTFWVFPWISVPGWVGVVGTTTVTGISSWYRSWTRRPVDMMLRRHCGDA